MQAVGRTLLIILFAAAVVLIGAEEIRRKTKKVAVSESSKQHMMHLLSPGHEGDPNARAQMKEEPADKENLDPTGLRSLIHRLMR